MNSLPMPVNKPFRPLLVAEGGVPYLRSTTVDPLDAWMDLMEAVEALVRVGRNERCLSDGFSCYESCANSPLIHHQEVLSEQRARRGAMLLRQARLSDGSPAALRQG